jgi:hypothetical protein
MFVYLLLQVILLFVITLHDWVHVPPLTDIRALEQHSTVHGRIINSTIFAIMVLIPLVLTWLYRAHVPFWMATVLVGMYGLLTFGTIASWWIPYIFGSSAAHKADFIEYQHTHHFLPKRGDNVVPNTFHVLLHLLIWSCCTYSLYLLWQTI